MNNEEAQVCIIRALYPICVRDEPNGLKLKLLTHAYTANAARRQSIPNPALDDYERVASMAYGIIISSVLCERRRRCALGRRSYRVLFFLFFTVVPHLPLLKIRSNMIPPRTAIRIAVLRSKDYTCSSCAR